MAENLTKNTLTNYLMVLVRFAQGILVTRWTIYYLGEENYGLWIVLWAIFAYSLLLDFGFGVSVQKYTGMGVYKTNPPHYRRIVSAVFLFHLAMAGLIVLMTVGLSFFVEQLFNVHDPEKVSYCRMALLLFGCGSAMVFPTTMFAGIAVGLQKIYLRNYVNSIEKVLEIIGTLAVFYFGGQIISLMVLVLGLTVCANLTIAFYVIREIPGFRFTLRIGLSTYKEIGKFSGFVYLVSLARLIMNRSSRLIISYFLGLGPAGLFHMASRLPEYCSMAAGQYQENVQPVTARLHAEHRTGQLKNFILRSLRINMSLGIFFMLPAYIFSDEILRVLFRVDSEEASFLCRLFMVSMFFSIALRRVVQGYLLMAEKHKIVSYMTIVESALNLILNIALIKRCGLQIIIINSMIIQLAVSLFVLFPVMLKSLRLRSSVVIRRGYLPAFFAGVAGALPAVAFHFFMRGKLSDFWMSAFGTIICSGVFLLVAWHTVFSKRDRMLARNEINRRLPVGWGVKL